MGRLDEWYPRIMRRGTWLSLGCLGAGLLMQMGEQDAAAVHALLYGGLAILLVLPVVGLLLFTGRYALRRDVEMVVLSVFVVLMLLVGTVVLHVSK